MFFAVVGNKEFASYEIGALESVVGYEHIRKNLVVFSIDETHATLQETLKKLSNCSTCIKRGTIHSLQICSQKIEDGGVDLVGVEKKELGLLLKKTLDVVKRFKIVDLIHTDKDMQSGGQEIVHIKADTYGLVQGYQNIPLYEIVDFEKPIRGMQVGMMPAKLTLLLINLALQTKKNDTDEYTVYDPFCGFGTTNMLANAYGYNTIGSDIQISSAKTNMQWRKEHDMSRKDKKVLVFKQDVTLPFEKPFLKHVDCIATEGWLGPIIKHKTGELELIQHQEKIREVYLGFLHNIDVFYDKMRICMTIPYYVERDISNVVDVQQWAEKNNRSCVVIPELYMRTKQVIARQIIILEKK